MASVFLLLLLALCAGLCGAAFGHWLFVKWIRFLGRRGPPRNRYVRYDEFTARKRQIERNGFKSRAGMR